MTVDDIIALNRIEELIGEQHHQAPDGFCYDNCPGCNGPEILDVVRRVFEERAALHRRVGLLVAEIIELRQRASGLATAAAEAPR